MFPYSFNLFVQSNCSAAWGAGNDYSLHLHLALASSFAVGRVAVLTVSQIPPTSAPARQPSPITLTGQHTTKVAPRLGWFCFFNPTHPLQDGGLRLVWGEQGCSPQHTAVHPWFLDMAFANKQLSGSESFWVGLGFGFFFLFF